MPYPQTSLSGVGGHKAIIFGAVTGPSGCGRDPHFASAVGHGRLVI